MGFADDVIDAMLELVNNGGAKQITTISLHTADPGSTGANEVTGGSYARAAITWAAASDGTKANSNELVWQIPAGTTITHLGGWDGSTFRGGGELAVPQPFASPGAYKMAAGQLTAKLETPAP